MSFEALAASMRAKKDINGFMLNPQQTRKGSVDQSAQMRTGFPQVDRPPIFPKEDPHKKTK